MLAVLYQKCTSSMKIRQKFKISSVVSHRMLVKPAIIWTTSMSTAHKD